MKEEKKKSIKDIIKSKLKKISNIALIVDGVSLAKDNMINRLIEIKKVVEEIGKIRTAKFIVKNLPLEDDLKKVQKLGFEVVIRASETDVYFMLEAMDTIYNQKIEGVAISTGNEEFLQVLNKGKEKGKKMIAINPQGSKLDVEMLKNLADITVDLNK